MHTNYQQWAFAFGKPLDTTSLFPTDITSMAALFTFEEFCEMIKGIGFNDPVNTFKFMYRGRMDYMDPYDFCRDNWEKLCDRDYYDQIGIYLMGMSDPEHIHARAFFFCFIRIALKKELMPTKESRQNSSLAFYMAMHPRCGVNSPARLLSRYLFQDILNLTVDEKKTLPIETKQKAQELITNEDRKCGIVERYIDYIVRRLEVYVKSKSGFLKETCSYCLYKTSAAKQRTGISSLIEQMNHLKRHIITHEYTLSSIRKLLQAYLRNGSSFPKREMRGGLAMLQSGNESEATSLLIELYDDVIRLEASVTESKAALNETYPYFCAPEAH